MSPKRLASGRPSTQVSSCAYSRQRLPRLTWRMPRMADQHSALFAAALAPAGHRTVAGVGEGHAALVGDRHQARLSAAGDRKVRLAVASRREAVAMDRAAAALRIGAAALRVPHAGQKIGDLRCREVTATAHARAPSVGSIPAGSGPTSGAATPVSGSVVGRNVRHGRRSADVLMRLWRRHGRRSRYMRRLTTWPSAASHAACLRDRGTFSLAS